MLDPVEVRKALDAAAPVDLSTLSDRALLDGAVMLERMRAFLDATQGRLLAEAEARGTCDRDHGVSTSTWLAREAGVPASVATTRVRVGTVLRSRLDQVGCALADGRIRWEHARVLVRACNPRIADRVAALQPGLVDLAQACSFDQWRREVHAIVDRLDVDGGHDPAGDLARNRLHLDPTFGGVTQVSGILVGEQAAVARHAIDTVAGELFRQFSADSERAPADLPVPSVATLRALAFVELCRRGFAAGTESTAAPRPDVTLVVRAEEPDHAVTGAGEPLGPSVVRTLCCDPDLHAVVVDSLGVPLDLGRQVRLASAGQRRALAVRDGGCVFPGCGAPVGWCDAHHVTPHRSGGRTDVANLALLCRRHHGVTHREGWGMRSAGDGWFTWSTPAGHTIHSQRHRRRAPASVPPMTSERAA